MERRLRYRILLKRARRFGVREVPGRGKGSERIWEREVGSRTYVATVTCHGEGYELGRGLIAQVRRRLLLDPEHGVSDHDFYDG